jgi:hypothetical protein
VEIRTVGVSVRPLDAIFGHLYGEGAAAPRRLTIIAHGERLLFYVEQRLVSTCLADGFVAQAKAVVTELYLDAADTGFLTHGALLEKGGRRLLLSGDSGAGKTTLALALAAAGWRYGGDDIVRIHPTGEAAGVPFAAAVKIAALPLLTEAWPQLSRLPSTFRADGREVRYLAPPRLMGPEPGPADLIVRLQRRTGARATTTPLERCEVLASLLDSAYARRWSLNGDALCGFAASLERATCVRLEYSHLGVAVRCIEDLADAKA